MVIGHLEIPLALYKYIFSFHMFAFFFISGMLEHPHKCGTLFAEAKKNAVALLIPYLFFAFMWDTVNLVSTFYLTGYVDLGLTAILKNIATVLLCGCVESNASIGPAWFLMALFVTKFIYSSVSALVKNNLALKGIICLALFVLGCAFNGIDELPFKLLQSFTSILFVWLGEAVATIIRCIDIKKLFNHIGRRLLLLLVAVGLGISVWFVSQISEKTVLLVSNTYPENFLYMIFCAIAGCISLLIVSISIDCLPFVSQMLQYYGKNSLIVMGIHSEIHIFFRLILEKLGVSTDQTVIPVFLITLLLIIPTTTFLKRYFPILVGKNKSRIAA